MTLHIGWLVKWLDDQDWKKKKKQSVKLAASIWIFKNTCETFVAQSCQSESFFHVAPGCYFITFLALKQQNAVFVHYFDPDRNIPETTGWVVMTLVRGRNPLTLTEFSSGALLLYWVWPT